MSDLISRSELIKELNKYCGNQRYLVSENIREIINNQPIAYSVAKVVEELKELKMRYFLTIANTGDEKTDFAYENVGNALDKAIEIVKQGGVSDDNLMIGCGDYFNLYDNCTGKFKFCPHCGKKINVLE